jgi:hypothetical protein
VVKPNSDGTVVLTCVIGVLQTKPHPISGLLEQTHPGGAGVFTSQVIGLPLQMAQASVDVNMKAERISIS